jgi:hypothetical protein
MGGDPKSVDVYTVLNTYNVELYERFKAAGYDLTERHEMASILGHGTSNRPLLGFVKRHRNQDSKIQMEVNIVLAYHVRGGTREASTSAVGRRRPARAGAESRVGPRMDRVYRHLRARGGPERMRGSSWPGSSPAASSTSPAAFHAMTGSASLWRQGKEE